MWLSGRIVCICLVITTYIVNNQCTLDKPSMLIHTVSFQLKHFFLSYVYRMSRTATSVLDGGNYPDRSSCTSFFPSNSECPALLKVECVAKIHLAVSSSVSCFCFWDVFHSKLFGCTFLWCFVPSLLLQDLAVLTFSLHSNCLLGCRDCSLVTQLSSTRPWL